MFQVLDNTVYKAQRGDTLSGMTKFWEDHTGTVRGVHQTHLPKFDLSVAQKSDFARRATRARLGLDPNVTPIVLPMRRVVVEVATA